MGEAVLFLVIYSAGSSLKSGGMGVDSPTAKLQYVSAHDIYHSF